MTNTNSTNPTIAFFGATGACTNACLVHTLKAGFSAAALARTPAKLQQQLLKQGLSQETISRQLIIIQGDAQDVSAVKRTLTAGHPTTPVSTIISGLGGTPSLTFNIWRPLAIAKLDNPTICASATTALFTALRQLYAENPAMQSAKPLACYISTTGVTHGSADVPFWMRFLYHQMLALPHEDKRNMETLYHDNVKEEGNKRAIRGFVAVRPTLLTGGESVDSGLGLEKVRVGRERKPETGYTVRRADVGQWMFENVVKTGGKGWEGEGVTLTS